MDGLDAYSPEEKRELLDLADRSIRHGLEHGRPAPVDPAAFPPRLGEPRALFVTLNRLGELRGCIGTLEAGLPLAAACARYAFAAAFQDPRFPPLQAFELDGLQAHLSVLTPRIPLSFSSEGDLISQLRPGKDGLVLEEGRHQATFLPSVWETLPDASEFVRHLKRKAGLPDTHWSPALRAFRYEAVSIP